MDELDAGTVLHGSYRLVSPLGEGGMGTVWLADHLRLPKQVAVKVLRSRSTGEAALRFRREAEIASRLRHPNIVEVVDFNVLETGQPYIVLELLHGQSLRDRLRHGALPVSEATDVLGQITSALEQAHGAGVVHRDLKPENIFLADTGDGSVIAKILDFGISKILDDSSFRTQDASVMGTPAYMSPEQASGQNSSIDARSDQFALGTIAYEMMTGKSPFRGTSIPEVVFKIVTYEPPALEEARPELPARGIDAIRRAMSKNKAERFPTVGHFFSEFSGRPIKERSRNSLPVSTKPMSLPSSTATGELPRWGEGDELDASEPTAIRSPESGREAEDGPVAEIETPSAAPIVLPQPAPEPGRSQRSSVLWVLALVLGGAAVAALLVMAFSAHEPSSGEPPDGGRLAAALVPFAASDASDAADPIPARDADPSDARSISASSPEEAPPTGRKGKVRDRSEPALLPAALADLDAAKQKLAEGRYEDAIRLAKRSMFPTRADESVLVVGAAYCGLKDLGNAKGMLRLLAAKKSSRELVKQCRAHGIELFE
ncbi:MAG: serine/threonine protein kinase [Deltaproteobacteria bacterium]|nr:serine/threonine protein kinase [Deltaproteobacteria bacterium]